MHFLFLMEHGGTVRDFQKYDENGAGGYTGPTTTNSWGLDIAGLGDVNGDGMTDVAWTLEEDATVVVASIHPSTYDIVLESVFGPSHALWQGASFTDLYTCAPLRGDRNGDGVDDIIIGTQGYLFVLYLNDVLEYDSGRVPMQVAATDIGSADSRVDSVDSIGDLDGDGVLDIVSSEYACDSNRGCMYVHFLNAFPDETVRKSVRIDPPYTDAAGWSFATTSIFFGVGLAFVERTDNFVHVVAPLTGHDSLKGGFYHLFLDQDGKVFNSVFAVDTDIGQTAVAGERIGRGVAIGDFNGDGIRDTVLGTFKSPSVFLVPGAPVVCGDGLRDLPLEECDDGNLADGDGCDASCKFECGNGAIDSLAEECDDGNRVGGDGCSPLCLTELVASAGTTGTYMIDVEASSGAFAGASYGLTNAGDLDGNGIDDLFMSDLSDDLRLIFLDPNGQILDTVKFDDTGLGGWSGVDSSSFWARHPNALGDMNHDGRFDLFIDATYSDNGHIVSLNGDYTIASVVTFPDSDPFFGGLAVSATNAGASIGDRNGDGIDDLVVGFRTSAGGYASIVYLDKDLQYSAENGFLLIDATAHAAVASGSRYGEVIVAIGDLDGNGATDFVANALNDGDVDLTEGAVYVTLMDVWSSSSDQMLNIVKFQQDSGDPLHPVAGSYFGSSLAFGGKHDGITHLIVGERGFDDTVNSNDGALHHLFLDENVEVQNYHFVAESVLDVNFGVTERFGAGVMTGYFDNDGIRDVVAVGKQRLWFMPGVLPVCGDGITDPSEECDPTNGVDAGSCTPSCERIADVVLDFWPGSRGISLAAGQASSFTDVWSSATFTPVSSTATVETDAELNSRHVFDFGAGGAPYETTSTVVAPGDKSLTYVWVGKLDWDATAPFAAAVGTRGASANDDFLFKVSMDPAATVPHGEFVFSTDTTNKGMASVKHPLRQWAITVVRTEDDGTVTTRTVSRFHDTGNVARDLSASFGSTTPAHATTVIGRGDGTEAWRGKLARAMIFDRTLSDADVDNVLAGLKSYYFAECGNGVLDAGEACDPARPADVGACLETCVLSDPVINLSPYSPSLTLSGSDVLSFDQGGATFLPASANKASVTTGGLNGHDVFDFNTSPYVSDTRLLTNGNKDVTYVAVLSDFSAGYTSWFGTTHSTPTTTANGFTLLFDYPNNGFYFTSQGNDRVLDGPRAPAAGWSIVVFRTDTTNNLFEARVVTSSSDHFVATDALAILGTVNAVHQKNVVGAARPNSEFFMGNMAKLLVWDRRVGDVELDGVVAQLKSVYFGTCGNGGVDGGEACDPLHPDDVGRCDLDCNLMASAVLNFSPYSSGVAITSSELDSYTEPLTNNVFGPATASKATVVTDATTSVREAFDMGAGAPYFFSGQFMTSGLKSVTHIYVADAQSPAGQLISVFGTTGSNSRVNNQRMQVLQDASGLVTGTVGASYFAGQVNDVNDIGFDFPDSGIFAVVITFSTDDHIRARIVTGNGNMDYNDRDSGGVLTALNPTHLQAIIGSGHYDGGGEEMFPGIIYKALCYSRQLSDSEMESIAFALLGFYNIKT